MEFPQAISLSMRPMQPRCGGAALRAGYVPVQPKDAPHRVEVRRRAHVESSPRVGRYAAAGQACECDTSAMVDVLV